MKTTGNLGLKKPEGTDIVDINDLNGNMDILDTAVKAAQDHAADTTKHITAAERTAWDAKASTAVATNSANGLLSAADRVRILNWATVQATNGTSTAYTCIVGLNTTLGSGLRLMIRPHVDSGANPTLNPGSLGAKPILKPNGSPAKLLKNGVYTLVYDTSALAPSGAFILQGEGGEYGTATAADVLSGKTIGTEDGVIEGTIPEWANSRDTYAVWAPWYGGRINVGFPIGAYLTYGMHGPDKADVTLIEPNFTAENIKAGVRMFGLDGTNERGNIEVYDGTSSGNSLQQAEARHITYYEIDSRMKKPVNVIVKDYYTSDIFGVLYPTGSEGFTCFSNGVEIEAIQNPDIIAIRNTTGSKMISIIVTFTI